MDYLVLRREIVVVLEIREEELPLALKKLHVKLDRAALGVQRPKIAPEIHRPRQRKRWPMLPTFILHFAVIVFLGIRAMRAAFILHFAGAVFCRRMR